MRIEVHSRNSWLSVMKPGTWADSTPKKEDGAPIKDQVAISQEGKESLSQAVELSPIEKAMRNTAREDFMAQLDAWRQEHQLEVNWNALVDPDGSVYAKAYVSSLAGQLSQTRQTVESYYQEGHKENLRFQNPYNHLVEKYQYSASPYFRGDMSEAQRAMAFRQERALLWGGSVVLNDPWALAASGGVPSGETVEAAARKAARDAIDALVAQYKKSRPQ